MGKPFPEFGFCYSLKKIEFSVNCVHFKQNNVQNAINILKIIVK